MSKIELEFPLLETLIPPKSTSARNLSMILRQSGAFTKRLIFNLELLIGFQVRSLLSAAIYRKQLRLSNAAKAKRSAVGLASLAAVGVIVLSVLCNTPLAMLQHKFHSKLVLAQDERLKAVSESTVNMKVLKLYAWEMNFKSVIERLRKQEIKLLKDVQLLRGCNLCLSYISPILASSVTLVACYFTGIPLNARNVFTFLATLGIVHEPVGLCPEIIEMVIHAKVAFRRIIQFLEAGEIECENIRQMDFAEQHEHAIIIGSGNLSWEENPSLATLRSINLEVKVGEKVAICGEVQVYGKIAYVSQVAWIQSGSIQDNILFGCSMDEQIYQETIEMCSLVQDLKMLPFGDLTEIGERGINLSGGQKQRIQLARALYQDADIYFLDDPFSAVDAHTAISIFNDYVIGALSGKTVLLVTHQVDFLPAFDSILVKESVEHQLVRQEERETGDIGLKPYFKYLNQKRSFFYFSVAVLCQTIFFGCLILQNYWLAANVQNLRISKLRLILVYTLIGCSSMFFVVLRALSAVALGLKSSMSIFDQLLNSLFHAPLAFYESTPLGRILSRVPIQVSSDLNVVDVDLPGSIRYFSASIKEIVRINGTTKSILASHLGESITGSMTIRAYEMEHRFFADNLSFIDKNVSTSFHIYSASEWLNQRLEILCITILCSTALLLVLLPTKTFGPGFVGMVLAYGLSLNHLLFSTVQLNCTLENDIISVERLNQYMRIPGEAPKVIYGNRPVPGWPAVGRVEIHDLEIRYRTNTPIVLKGISCIFGGGHKIGIVGRTGSGKSTLIGALFRLVEPVGGKIVIDGVDISTIGLYDLRSRLGIIPQDPTLFIGTVRYNLDPLSQHTDQEIWEVLGKCQLRDSVQDKQGGLDSLVQQDGVNWSMGQRQLFCLGRALLRRSQILVLDEATASIDNATDFILQKTIRSEFASCTVITVAHRIPTVMDSTMILAISDGKIIEYDEPMKLMKEEGSLFAQLVKEYWSHIHST
ncbi:hypothetical protein C5167_040975 [Papaver somniferum]|uniref:ABC transporter domain-containing protein n=1 Tax=Papaver somniferum TaxID=3469 RepID=A0A4Y7IJY3_PAPSO|nr:hypothetical protein C5167_040975 [Papaver somniferum]